MKNVYCLYSLDNKRIIRMRKEIIKESGVDDFNISIFDLDDTPLDKAIEDAYTIPFLSDNRVVVLTNANFLSTDSKLTSDEKPKKDKKDKKESLTYSLEEYLKAPVETTILILECACEKLDSKKEVVKIIRDRKWDVEIKLPDKPLIIKYIDDKVNEKGYTFKTAARDELIRRVVEDPLNFEGELDKLFLYMESSRTKSITIDMIQGLIVDSKSVKLYELMNSLLDNNKKRALEIYYDLLEEGYKALQILNFLVRNFSQILYVKELILSRSTQEDIARIIGVSTGQAYHMMRNARGIDYKKLSRCLDELKELDYSSKVDFKYGTDEAIGFELFLLKQ